MVQDDINRVIGGLDNLILSNLKGVANQEYFPCSNPDDMDERIKTGRERAKTLRRLRQEFEDCITGICGPVV